MGKTEKDPMQGDFGLGGHIRLKGYGKHSLTNLRTWERHVGKVSMDDFKDVNSAYTVMDTSEDLTEFRKFLNDLKQPIVKEVLFTFKGLDENFDDKLTAEASCPRW
ncbi:hypothetical protein AK812_SmicGene12438 [Symbiodinium microadriaticum]|uniref:Uncharacterized protein n=1 Tax=Symbiodinium microadriaticum TaxID=2951 RepID=A0A1Q9EAT0_SYMMI|nr:hypothetical protein AK812_SmicGene12438 [Symbiodinium microadriaticum]